MLGFNVGCSVVETFFRSTFECVYIIKHALIKYKHMEQIIVKYLNPMNSIFFIQHFINNLLRTIVHIGGERVWMRLENK
jgi:hypothetical protein